VPRRLGLRCDADAQHTVELVCAGNARAGSFALAV
jgi:hypothetical protein